MYLRDDPGVFILAKTTWFSLLCECDVDVGEVVGLHTPLEWMGDLRFDNVYFVLNSKTVVKNLKIGINDNSEFGCILYVCKQFLHNSFQYSHVEFSLRQTNGSLMN